MSEPPETDRTGASAKTEETATTEPTGRTETSCEETLTPLCECPRGDHGLVVHEETCLMYRHETLIFPGDERPCECDAPQQEELCKCCECPPRFCKCFNVERDDDKKRLAGMPMVLEATHPLMQKFQESLRLFLEKENERAEKEILDLRENLKLAKLDYDGELESIYRTDHDTNAQRALILEYESTLVEKAKDRAEAEKKMKIAGEKYNAAQAQLEQQMITDRDTKQEIEALSALVRQLEAWREGTESDLTISQLVTDQMKKEKKVMAAEKKEMDMLIYAMNNEVWNLESKLELMKKQMEIKSVEMAKVNDRVIEYATELEDLELDKKRLISLWNSVLVNIKQRDNVFGTIRDDYRDLQENYHTLLHNLEVTKKAVQEEMRKSKELEMNKDKLNYQINAISKTFEPEDIKREAFEQKIDQLKEAIFLNERDQEMIKMENQTMRNILATTEKEYDNKCGQKLKLENEILENLQECLLNDKAVEAMANGIKKMRDMSRKLEIALMKMENQHAQIMLEIEVYRNRQVQNAEALENNEAKVRAREKELDAMQEKYDQKTLFLMKKQRELDIILKKNMALKEIYDFKSPQEIRIIGLEQQIKALRERTETLQNEWLRLQGHVVKLTKQYHKCAYDVNLINKQIQICDQKTMGTDYELESVRAERVKVERSLRDLRSRLQVLERTRKEANERNENTKLYTHAMTYEYTANLKDAESKLFELEDDIEKLEKEKIDLTQELDQVQREALVWQRKGILAVELKRSIHDAKAASGEIGQMKHEIHRMEVRREQLRRTGEKLAEDLAQYVMRRDNAMEKNRAMAAVEAAKGTSGSKTSQSQYHHKLRLVRADVARVTKEVQEAKVHADQLRQEWARLESDTGAAHTLSAQLEENVASLLHECEETERNKQWLLERVVRSQRLGSELATALKRHSLKIKKPKNAVLSEYSEAKALNETLQYIVDTLIKDHPYLKDKLQYVANTLNIMSPDSSPRLVEDAPCGETEDVRCTFPVPQPPEPPYCHCPAEQAVEQATEQDSQ